MQQSIFSEENKVQSSFEGEIMKFVQFGDKVEGTVVGQGEHPSAKYPGQVSRFVDLKVRCTTVRDGAVVPTNDGDLWRVYTNSWLDVLLDNNPPRLGQIVGFEYTGQKPSSKGNPTKIIEMHANPDVVDQEWLDANAGKVAAQAQPAVAATADTYNAAQKAEAEDFVGEMDASLTPEQQREDIIALAVEKLGATDERDAERKVMEKTSKAFLEVNYREILRELRAL